MEPSFCGARACGTRLYCPGIVTTQVAALRATLADEEAHAASTEAEDEQRDGRILQDAIDMASRRQSNSIEKCRTRSAG